MIWFFSRWWRDYKRSIDRDILWPEMLKQAQSRPQAEGAFLVHMDMDSAYGDMSDAEKDAYVKSL